MNNVVLVGRLTKDPEIKKLSESSKKTIVTLAVARNYKNSDGIYDTDFIRCVLWNTVASSTCEYCHKGDVVGVKGRIETSSFENEEKKISYLTEVIVERITFLTPPKQKEK